MEASKKDGLELLQEIAEKQLLSELVMQLNKDARLAGTDLSLPETAPPRVIAQELYKFLQGLIRKDFDAYVNFLYRADIPESSAGWSENADADTALREITLRILQREWQKVWFRNRNR